MSDNPPLVTPEEARQMTCPQNRMLCDADKCMAWRWIKSWQYDEETEDVVVDDQTHGRCGMVPT